MGGAAAAAGLATGRVGPASSRPDLVFVFRDQMRGGAMGFPGEEPVITPRLGRFARQALVLPECVSNYPVCGPYRAMLMTGMYPHGNGVLASCTSEVAQCGGEHRAGDRRWSDVLKDEGYSLGYIGRWHLDAPLRAKARRQGQAPELAALPAAANVAAAAWPARGQD
jgi:arylsulfatase A-like enzyme